MQQKCGPQGYHRNSVIRGFFRLGWWTNMYTGCIVNIYIAVNKSNVLQNLIYCEI